MEGVENNIINELFRGLRINNHYGKHEGIKNKRALCNKIWRGGEDLGVATCTLYVIVHFLRIKV